MQSVTREANGNVVIRSDNITLRSFHQWGGCPLEFWSEPNPGPLTNPFPGSAINPTCEVGQDPTQASSDGMTMNPIARIGNTASIIRNNYYIREVAPWSPTKYRIQGFFPIFWLSHESIDDVIVPLPLGLDDGWRTRYRPGNFGAVLQQTPTAIYLESTAGNRNIGGYFAPGNELLSTQQNLWPDRLFTIPDGRMAARITVSLANAFGDGTSAGFAFRKIIPRLCSDVDYVTHSQGYLFRVTKTGVWELIGGAIPDTRISYGKLNSTEKKLLSTTGLELELRTHNGIPGHVELYIANRLVFMADNLSVRGGGFFLYGKCGSGFVCFDQKRLYDVSINSLVSYEPLPNATIRYSVKFEIVPEAQPRPFYRANMNFFMSPTIFPIADRSTGYELPDGTFVEQAGVTGMELPPLGEIKSLWIGNKAGTIGLSATPVAMKVDGQDTLLTGNAHAQVQKQGANNEFVMGINALDIGNNSSPRPCNDLELVVDIRDHVG